MDPEWVLIEATSRGKVAAGPASVARRTPRTVHIRYQSSTARRDRGCCRELCVVAFVALGLVAVGMWRSFVARGAGQARCALLTGARRAGHGLAWPSDGLRPVCGLPSGCVSHGMLLRQWSFGFWPFGKGT